MRRDPANTGKHLPHLGTAPYHSFELGGLRQLTLGLNNLLALQSRDDSGR
jgi:hypothetical protein